MKFVINATPIGCTKVLFIDYSDTSQYLLSILINQFKCQVEVVTSEEELADNLQKGIEFIMIIDKHDGESGFEIAQQFVT